MQSYGPFMMVRFCAAIGIGGCMPAAAAYLCEITPLSSRARYVWNGNKIHANQLNLHFMLSSLIVG